MKTIFVVDDNSINLLIADEALSSSYNVYTFISARTMFEMLNDVMPDLILLDIQMPDIDGFEALRRLQTDNRCTHIPVIFFTSLNKKNIKAQGFEAGIVDYILKPFSKQVLLDCIEKHLR